MSFLLKIENIAKSSKILISAEADFSRSKDRSRTHDQKLLKFHLVNFWISRYILLSTNAIAKHWIGEFWCTGLLPEQVHIFNLWKVFKTVSQSGEKLTPQTA